MPTIYFVFFLSKNNVGRSIAAFFGMLGRTDCLKYRCQLSNEGRSVAMVVFIFRQLIVET